jgi:cytidylate kinase
MKKIIIAIDGYSSTGKSTLAKAIAKEMSFTYIDSGAMYRAVTLYAINNDMIIRGELDKGLLLNKLSEITISFHLNASLDSQVVLNNVVVENKIRGMEVSSWVSIISAIPEVREMLVQQQQFMGLGRGVVMDGRDIGSVVFPDAELKIFMTASPDVRAKRRFDELRRKGEEVSFDAVLKNITERDLRDTQREIAPLIKTPDAILLDNSTMTLHQQFEWLVAKVNHLKA